MASSENQNVKLNYPGIRLYFEDPKAVIKKQIRRTIYIFISALFIALILVFLASQIIKKESNNLAVKQKTINTSLQDQSIDPSSEKALEEIQPNIEKIKNALPDPTNLLGYQGALEDAAKAAGVQVSTVFSQTKATSSQAGNANSKTSSGVDHQVEVKGPVANIIQFIQNLENLPYFVQINSFKISIPESQDKDASANLSLKVFTLAPTSTTSAKPQNLPSSL